MFVSSYFIIVELRQGLLDANIDSKLTSWNIITISHRTLKLISRFTTKFWFLLGSVYPTFPNSTPFNINNTSLPLLDSTNIAIEKSCLARTHVSAIHAESFSARIRVCIVTNKCTILIKNCPNATFVGNGFPVYPILEFTKYLIPMHDRSSVTSVQRLTNINMIWKIIDVKF